MPLLPPKPLPPSQHIPVVSVDATGAVAVTQPWQEYFASTDSILRQLANAVIGSLINANSDVAAAAAGVPIGGLYRNVNAVQIRIA